jgi:hypothetical protein
MKISNDAIGNRSRDLPVCSAVRQPLRHRVLPSLLYGLEYRSLIPGAEGSVLFTGS